MEFQKFKELQFLTLEQRLREKLEVKEHLKEKSLIQKHIDKIIEVKEGNNDIFDNERPIEIEEKDEEHINEEAVEEIKSKKSNTSVLVTAEPMNMGNLKLEIPDMNSSSFNSDIDLFT